jgi:DNA-binding transcriptional LysR family regulator
MTLKQLEALYWAGTLGSFALAAQRLCTTQSALSKRIQELEEELGEPLFDRTGPRARITVAGERVLVHAGEMLRTKDDILAAARGPQGLRGSSPFGVSEFVASCWLPEIVTAIRARYPEVTLEPRVGVTGELMQELARGETDFAIGASSTPNASIASGRLFEVDMAWIAAPAVAASLGTITRERLADTPVLSTSPQSGATAALHQWALARGIKFRQLQPSNSMNAVASLAAAGLGVCVQPRPFAQRFVEDGRLAWVDAAPDCLVPPIAYFLHWRADDQRVLTARLREVVAEQSAVPPWAQP